MVSFPPVSPTKTLYTPLSSLIHATCPVHLIVLHFITRTILGEQYKSFSSSLCNLLHYIEYIYNLRFFTIFPLCFQNFFFHLHCLVLSALKYSDMFHFRCFCLPCVFCLYDTIFSFINIHERCCHVIHYTLFRFCGLHTGMCNANNSNLKLKRHVL